MDGSTIATLGKVSEISYRIHKELICPDGHGVGPCKANAEFAYPMNWCILKT